MTIARIEPAPGPEEWEKRLRAEPARNLPNLRHYAIQMLYVNHQAWNPLVGIAERVMRDRGIEF
jgi:hypothetical protein